MATPSLNPFHYHTGLLPSDLTSIMYSQSEGQSESQTPGGSATDHHQQHSADNPRQTNPTSLSYYQGTEVYEALIFARNAFTATAFSTGYFFYHQSSPHLKVFKTFAQDLIAQGAKEHEGKYFNFY